MATLPLGALIRRRRVQLGLTQHELAARISLGITGADVAVMEDDAEAHPRLDWVERIAAALELAPEALLREAGLAPLWPVGAEPALVRSRMQILPPADARVADEPPFARLHAAIIAARATRDQTAALRGRILEPRTNEAGRLISRDSATHCTHPPEPPASSPHPRLDLNG